LRPGLTAEDAVLTMDSDATRGAATGGLRPEETAAANGRPSGPPQGSEGASSRDAGRGLLKNSAAIFVCRVLAILAALVSVPVVIRAIGFQGYGVWESLLALSVLAAVPQNIVGGTLLWKMSVAFGAGERHELVRFARIGIFVTAVYVSLAAPLMLWCSPALVRLLRVPFVHRIAAERILPVMLGTILLGGVCESLAAIMRGSQRAGWAIAIQTGAAILNAGVTITCLSLGRGLYSLLAGYVTAFAVTVVVSYIVAKRLCPDLTLLPALPRASDLRSARKYAACLLLGSASSSLRTETDKLILATFASTIWVGYYAIAARIASLVMETSNFFVVPAIAAVGSLHGQGDEAGIRKLYSRLMILVPVGIGAVVAMVAASGKEIMVLWIRTYEPHVEPILMLLLCGCAAAVLLTGPGACVCKGIGRIEVETMYIAVCLVVNLGLTIVLVASLGAMGTVIATAVSWVAGSLYFIYVFDQYLNFSFRESVGALKCLLAIVPVVLLHRWMVPHLGFVDSRLSVFTALTVNSLSLLAVFFPVMILIGVIPYKMTISAATRFKARFLVADGPMNEGQSR
jgi:O-antigen/teichoic acid export membrane protein